MFARLRSAIAKERIFYSLLPRTNQSKGRFNVWKNASPTEFALCKVDLSLTICYGKRTDNDLGLPGVRRRLRCVIEMFWKPLSRGSLIAANAMTISRSPKGCQFYCLGYIQPTAPHRRLRPSLLSIRNQRRMKLFGHALLTLQQAWLSLPMWRAFLENQPAIQLVDHVL